MPDVHTKAQRSYNMSRIRGKDTTPELVVRRLVHGMGFRYRLHVRSLPGKPDLVFTVRRKVILVHGCFWHRHDCRLGRPMPATRCDFWRAKFEGNLRRDAEQVRVLRRLGWRVMIIWQCDTESSKADRLARRIGVFLKGPTVPKRGAVRRKAGRIG